MFMLTRIQLYDWGNPTLPLSLCITLAGLQSLAKCHDLKLLTLQVNGCHTIPNLSFIPHSADGRNLWEFCVCRSPTTSYLVLFRPGLASALRWLWLSQHTGQAKAVNQGLALAWPGPGRGFCMYLPKVYRKLIRIMCTHLINSLRLYSLRITTSYHVQRNDMY
jgi:hypothetical protein